MNLSLLDHSFNFSSVSTTSSFGDLNGLLAPVLTNLCCDNQTELTSQQHQEEPFSSIELSVFRLQGVKKHFLEGCLIISAVSLVASFLVYCILPELRTVPGKCLMGLIVSELVTDCLVIAALQFQPRTTACFAIGVAIHYFFLSIVCWTSVIAFDLLKKFKYPNQQLRHFVRYIFYVYLFPLVIVSLALSLEFSPRTAHSPMRPQYGQKICMVSAPISKLIFITIPINASLLVNVIIFLFAIFKIKQVVNEISHSSISTSIKERCMWYAKLSLLLGISCLFGFFGIQLPCCQLFKFISFLINSLHGAFIFIAFTCKRSTFRLLVKHLLPCRQMKSNAAINYNKSIKLTPEGNDSHESNVRATTREMYRGLGLCLATTTTISSSNENTPQRCPQLPLHSFCQSWPIDPNRANSCPKSDSIVIVTATLQDTTDSKEGSPIRQATPDAPT